MVPSHRTLYQYGHPLQAALVLQLQQAILMAYLTFDIAVPSALLKMIWVGCLLVGNAGRTIWEGPIMLIITREPPAGRGRPLLAMLKCKEASGKRLLRSSASDIKIGPFQRTVLERTLPASNIGQTLPRPPTLYL